MSSLVLVSLFSVFVAVGEPQTRPDDASQALERARDLQRQAETESGPDAEAHRRAALQLIYQARQAAVARVALSTLVYDAAGHVPSTTTSTLTGRFTTYVYARRSVCELAGTRSEMPTDAGFGWRVTGRPIGVRTAEPSDDPSKAAFEPRVLAVDIQVDWQRMWDGGKPVNGPSGSSRLTLRSGDRVPLDNISATAIEGGCGGTAMTLYVSPGGEGIRTGAGRAAAAGARSGGGAGGVGSVRGRAASPSGGGSGGGRAGGVSPSAGGAVFGGGGGRRSVSRLGAAGGGTAGGVFSGGSGVPNRCAPETPLPPTALRVLDASGNCSVVEIDSSRDPSTLELETVSVELWLVHTRPGGPEEVQYQKVQTTPPAGRFAFAPAVIETPPRFFVAEVLGLVQARRLTDGSERLGFAVMHKVLPSGNSAGAASNVDDGGSIGTGGRSIAMPKPGEVVSVEIPSGPRALAGHSFALRVRVTR